MAGIILVTKPPFLFPPENHYNSTALKNILGNYLDRKFVLYDLRGKFIKYISYQNDGECIFQGLTSKII